MSDSENFPETVKEVRRQLAISQEDLAQAHGVSFATVTAGKTAGRYRRSWRSGGSSCFVSRK